LPPTFTHTWVAIALLYKQTCHSKGKVIKLGDTEHWLMEERPAETKAVLKKFFRD
jgi:hypothetical protein